MTLDTFAAQSAAARRDATPASIPEGLDGPPFDAAYRLQDAYAAAVTADAGPIAGYKLAVNGLPQQLMLGVTLPVSARVFANEIHHSGATLARADYHTLCIEPEIAAILGDAVVDVSTPANRAEAKAVVAHFQPAIELIDTLGGAVSPAALPAAVALNVFNAGIVLGPQKVAPADLHLTDMAVTMTLDGNVVAEVSDNAPQHPADAVMWLLHHLKGRGIAAEPGMVVMCGAHVPLWPLDPAVRQVDIAMRGLGTAGFTLTG